MFVVGLDASMDGLMIGISCVVGSSGGRERDRERERELGVLCDHEAGCGARFTQTDVAHFRWSTFT